MKYHITKEDIIYISNHTIRDSYDYFLPRGEFRKIDDLKHYIADRKLKFRYACPKRAESSRIRWLNYEKNIKVKKINYEYYKQGKSYYNYEVGGK